MARSPEAPASQQHVVADLAALKAIADPIRLQLMVQLQRPHTVKEAAAALDVPPTRLYYHVQILQKHGLVKVVARRKVSGIEEKTYQTVAEGWTVAPDLVGSLETSGALSALFDLVRAEVSVALRRASPETVGNYGSSVPFLSLSLVAMTRRQLVRFQKNVEKLLEAHSWVDSDPPEGAENYHLFIAGYREPAGLSEGGDGAARD